MLRTEKSFHSGGGKTAGVESADSVNSPSARRALPGGTSALATCSWIKLLPLGMCAAIGYPMLGACAIGACPEPSMEKGFALGCISTEDYWVMQVRPWSQASLYRPLNRLRTSMSMSCSALRGPFPSAYTSPFARADHRGKGSFFVRDFAPRTVLS